jgi:hypothetical protein
MEHECGESCVTHSPPFAVFQCISAPMIVFTSPCANGYTDKLATGVEPGCYPTSVCRRVVYYPSLERHRSTTLTNRFSCRLPTSTCLSRLHSSLLFPPTAVTVHHDEVVLSQSRLVLYHSP